MNIKVIYFALFVLVASALGSIGYESLETIEDFDALITGSINMQHEIIEFGLPVELWNAQENSLFRCDSGRANVVTKDGGQCLELVNRDSDGQLDTVYACMYLGNDNRITDIGTIYLQYQADGPNECIIGFNDNLPGYESDILGANIGDENLYQGTANYSCQSALLRLGADQEFYAYHDDMYIQVDMGLSSDTWYEMWIQFDVSNKATRYYVSEAEDIPSVVINPATGGQWWFWRDKSTASIDNIKFFVGAAEFQSIIWVDNIRISQEFVTPYLGCPDCKLSGDADMDGDVDILDFLVLKSNYGTNSGATWDMGDFDGDSDVDIFDFLILKSYYGQSGGAGDID